MAILGSYIVPHPPLIIPEIGEGEEKKIQRTVDSYENVAKEIGELKPDTIIVISPHSIMYQDYIHISPGEKTFGDFEKYGQPRVGMTVSYDTELVSLIEEEIKEMNVSAGTLGEQDKALDHGTMIPLYFVNKYYKDYKVIRIGISGLTLKEHYAFGMCIKESVEKAGRNAVIIASGDLSHRLKKSGPYDFAPEGPQFDARVTMGMAGADFKDFLDYSEEFCDAAGECGHRGFVIMAGALDRTAVDTEFLSYEGPFGVGYAVCKYRTKGEDQSRNFLDQYMDEKKAELEAIREKEDAYVKLARRSLESFLLRRCKLQTPEDLAPEFTEKKAGVFVSIKKDGRLRGCMGTIKPVENCVADEIINNALAAGFGDTRFNALKEHELDEIQISVDVLGEPEKVDSVDMLDPQKYGVIVGMGCAEGLLLPNLEGITTVEQQVAIALQKAGIPKTSGFEIKRFEVERHV